MTSKFKPLVLYATDFYKLSSLLVRRVLLSKPVGNLAVYKQKTKQLLLDQSRPSASPNLAAVQLLHLDKEFGLLKYYGIQEYVRRWIKSRSSSIAQSAQQKVGVGGTTSSVKSNDNTNVARVAFMITSEQRQKLSVNLGYTHEDIRSFKPIEALLLIENNVTKTNEDDVQYNFRDRLKELVDANEKLMAEQATSSSASSTANVETEGEKIIETPQTTVSPEDAEHAHVKADVAMALLSAEKGGDQTMEGLTIKKEEEPTEDKSINDNEVTSAIAIVDEDDAQKQESDDTSTKTSTAKESETSTTPATSVSVKVTPNDSTELHMKPDIAAAYISSHLQTEESSVGVSDVNESDEEDDDGPGWYEVVMSSIEDGPEEKDEQEDVVVALFATKKEALQCVDIKKKLASGKDKRYSVRRRWNA